jgi:uncharacterized protein
MPGGATSSRPRAVLDSNVLISAFAFPGGNPYAVLQALLREEIIVFISPFILTEVSRNLQDKLLVPEATVREAESLLRDHCILLDPAEQAAVPELTPADNRVLDCAVAGEVQYLVTGDRGILQLGEYQGVKIVNPAGFAGVLRGARGSG